MKKDFGVFFSAVFFVLGFSAVFSLLGVLLQSVLSAVSYGVQEWLSRLSGLFIIFFGLYLMKLIQPKFLLKSKVLKSKSFKSKYLTSFAFGASFAIGWTPCVGAVLGSILALAVNSPSNAFLLLFFYSLGLGLPFLFISLFVDKSKFFVKKFSSKTNRLSEVFGFLLVVVGVFVFTNQLKLLVSFEFLTNFFNGAFSGVGFNGLSYGVSFFAGLVSFLSPCVLPLVPGFLAVMSLEVKD